MQYGEIYMSFANLKSSRGSSIDQLVKAAEAVSTKTEYKVTTTMIGFGNQPEIKQETAMP